jgi:hypothetical protein
VLAGAALLVLTTCTDSKAATVTRTSNTSASTTTTTPVPTARIEKLTGGTTSPYVYGYTVEYPQLDGLADQAEQRAINAELTNAASNLVGDFVAGVATWSTGTSTTTSSTTSSSTSSTTLDPRRRSSMEAKEETTLLDSRVASFRIEATSVFAGAAHPTTTDHTFSFDLSTGRPISLSDLFRPGSGYLEWMSAESLKQLAASKDYTPDTARQGTTPTVEHFATFSLRPTGLEVIFGEYQVGPYALGIQRVGFPYAQLRPLLATPGPLDGR